jgi:hypothetical protein
MTVSFGGRVKQRAVGERQGKRLIFHVKNVKNVKINGLSIVELEMRGQPGPMVSDSRRDVPEMCLLCTE